MSALEVEQEIEKQETPAERADRTMEGVRVDFGSRDKWAMRQLKESPGVPDHVEFLRQVSDEGMQLQEQMKEAIGKGDDKSDDLYTKVKIEALRDKVRTWAHHAFKEPGKPGDVEYLQTQWEQAGDQFKREHTKTTERVLAALKGELSFDEVKKMRTSGELSWREGRLDDIIQGRGDMSPEKLAALQGELSATLERLRALEPQVETLAKEKSIRRAKKPEPFTRSPELQPYEDSYKRYQELKDDVLRLLKEIGE